jgi:MATE family multidrug resistance protein
MTVLNQQLEIEKPQRAILELLHLAAPTVAQAVSYTVMQFIDTWMLSRLGTEAPTAAGNAGMLAFSVICFGWGTLLCVNTLVSQSFGRKDFHECGQYLWQGFWVGVIYSLLILPLIPLGREIFLVVGHSPQLAHLEGIYLRIVLCTVSLKMIGTAAGQFLLGTNRPGSVFASAAAGVGVNALLGYTIVLGHFGFQKHGVAGAAWAQNVGVMVEMLVLLYFVFRGERKKFNVMDWRLRWDKAITLVRIGAGAGLQTVADVLAWTMFLAFVMAKLGESAMAANLFMFRYMTVSFMPAVGIGQAVTALVGRYIGRQRLDLAVNRAHLGFLVAAIYMLLCGIAMAIFRYPLIRVFSSNPQVVRTGAVLLIFGGIYQVFDAMYLVYNGALRGAGDTFVPAIVTASLCWGITVLGGYFIATNFPQLGVAGPWTTCTIYGIALGFFMMMRFRRGGWKMIHLEQQSNVAVESAKLSVA